jgi:hypothetical protein
MFFFSAAIFWSSSWMLLSSRAHCFSQASLQRMYASLSFGAFWCMSWWKATELA